MNRMWRQKIVKGLLEVPNELQRLLKGYYPAFVTATSPEPLRDEAPVFMFHSVSAPFFEEQLAYLQHNGYRTLNLEEFMAFLCGELRITSPAVLLTFDDGDISWYRVAYPLLKEYGFTAVGFLVPGFIREQPDPTGSARWLSWPEVAEMEASGVMEMQSHTYHHDSIFTAPKLVDFFHPHYEANPLQIDTPWIGQEEIYTNNLQLGTPIFQHASRYSSYPRYFDDPQVREACVSWVAEQGGDTFFNRPNWRRSLKEYFRIAAVNSSGGFYETKTQQREAILSQLTKARQTLQDRLKKPVKHLCYPWGAGSQLAVRLSQEAGYQSNFWVTAPGRRTNRPGTSPFYITRVKDDYIFRLPGRERKPLAEIFSLKLHRRAKNLNLY